MSFKYNKTISYKLYKFTSTLKPGRVINVTAETLFVKHIVS